jgi:hypothetical protein
MSSALVAIACPDDLVAQINHAHEEAHRQAIGALEHAVRCGALLLQARRHIPHGSWLEWVKDNLNFGARQCQKYMSLARNGHQLNTHSGSHSINEAMRALADQRHRSYRDQLDMLDEPPADFFDDVPSSVIKPSDNWSFASTEWQPLTFDDRHGYIIGEVYANCLWFYARPGDIVVDPMAGSGMIQRVYDDRATWALAPFEVDLRMFDLAPRGPYAARIGQNDLLAGLPIEADYVIMDVPYLAMCAGQYCEHPSNLADFDHQSYAEATRTIAGHVADAQQRGGRATILSPNLSSLKSASFVPVSTWWSDAIRSCGYEIIGKAYHPRRREIRRGPGVARNNNLAKTRRVPLTDIIEVMTFERRI